MDSWKTVEEAAVAKRTARVHETLAKLLGPSSSPDKDPRIGLCLSGGGWRAMTSACALFDALSTPLEATETASNTPGIKLLDTVTHAFGLSGGSWMLFTTLAGGARNPFHTPPIAGGPAPPHPWLFGTANAFDEAVHCYEGLAHMVSKDNVDRACYRSSTRQTLSMLTSKVGADSTIPTAMVSQHLGKSLVERWSNFIANNILNFVDGYKIHAIPQEAVGDGTGRIETDEGKSNASRSIKFGDLKQLVENGDLPFVVCSAIANRPLGEGEKPSRTTRGYDWTEFTPYFSRRPSPGILVPHTDDLCGYFADGRAETDLVRLRVHNLMAICGSAFACDVACALPDSVSSAVSSRVTITSDPLLGGGVTDVVFDSDHKKFGVLRDAGIDFNVPLPPMLPEACRAFDIIVVHDGGAGSKNAHELQRAVDLGYIKLAPAPFTPETPFFEGERVRVFRGLPGYPTVIYFLGLTERGTHQIALGHKALIADVKKCRENALRQLIPVMLSEMRIVRAMKQSGAAAGAAETAAATVHTKAVAFKKSSSGRRAGDPNESDEEEEEAAAAALEADGQQQPPSFNALAQGLVVNGMALGKVKDSLDAYQLIEKAIFAGLPDTKRLNSITTLEVRSLKVLEGGAPQQTLPPLSTEISSPDVNEVMMEFGIMEKRAGGPPGSKDGDMSTAWVEYYAAVAILSTLAPNEGLGLIGRVGCPPSVSKDKLSNFSLSALPLGCKVWSLLSIGAKKLSDANPASLAIMANFFKTVEESAAAQLFSIVSHAATIDDLEEKVEQLVRNVCLVFLEQVTSSSDTAALQQFAATLSRLVAVVQAISPQRWSFEAGDLAASFGSFFARSGHFPLLYVVLGVSSSPRLAVQPFASPRKEEQLFSIMDAGCTSDSKLRKQQILSLFEKELKMTPSYELCVRYALPRLISPFVTKHLDDRASVTALLDSQVRHAVRNKRRAAEFTVCEMWNEGAGSHEFRGWIAAECMQRRYYWDFVAPRVVKVEIPADPVEAQAAVEFAEKCRRLQQVDVRGNLGHNLVSRLNSVQQRAHEKRLVAEEKITKVADAVVSAAGAKLTSLAGKFGFGKK
jgi:hypothetical protein